ncbi:MAG: hypothetical protein KJ655_00695 [Candidatus Thermoplasmatota archaeon]|nr:hypothetical protein [Candidatus Thermoplasmatota archaeon]
MFWHVVGMMMLPVGFFFGILILLSLISFPLWGLWGILLMFLTSYLAVTISYANKTFFMPKEADTNKVKTWKAKMDKSMKIFGFFEIMIIVTVVGLIFFCPKEFIKIFIGFFVSMAIITIFSFYHFHRKSKEYLGVSDTEFESIKKQQRDLSKKYRWKIYPYYISSLILSIIPFGILVYLVFFRIGSFSKIFLMVGIALIMMGISSIVTYIGFHRNRSYFYKSSEITFGVPRKEFWDRIIKMSMGGSIIFIIMGIIFFVLPQLF